MPRLCIVFQNYKSGTSLIIVVWLPGDPVNELKMIYDCTYGQGFVTVALFGSLNIITNIHIPRWILTTPFHGTF